MIIIIACSAELDKLNKIQPTVTAQWISILPVEYKFELLDHQTKLEYAVLHPAATAIIVCRQGAKR